MVVDKVMNKGKFIKDIKIKPNKEKERIEKLQQQYKDGLIEESEISNDDYQKLLELYDEQNEKLEQEIENDKIQIQNMLKKLKNNT